MTFLRRLIAGLVTLLRKAKVERELDEELRAYLDESVDAKILAGMPRDRALRAARAEIGSLEAVKDYTRDAGWEADVERVWRDVGYAARTLRRAPAFALVAVLTLSFGIGANTAIFSAINMVMLRPLPVERPSQLISLSAILPDSIEPVFSFPAYRQFAEDGITVVDALAASRMRSDAITIDAAPEPIHFKWVSGNYFATLGVPAALGRTLTESDDREPPGAAVAMLSDAFWARRFGRDRSVVGRTFRFNAVSFTIVGVAPRGFFGETGAEAPDLWMPLTSQPNAPQYLWRGHSTTWLAVIGRLRPGVTIEQARATLDVIYDRVRDEVARGTDSAGYRRSVLASRLSVASASRGSARLRGQLSTPLLILMALVVVVLMIACANVANLLLARAATRQREIAICLAIGAGRLRVVRQGLFEALILAALGGAGGLVIAYWASSALGAAIAGALPLAIDLHPDIRVLSFTVAVTVAAAFVFGLVPAWRAAHIDPLPALKTKGDRHIASTRVTLRRALVVTQIAASVVLVVIAGLFVRSLLKINGIDPGFNPDRVVVFAMSPPATAPPMPIEQRRNLMRALIERAEGVPGVYAASASVTGLFSSGTWGNAISVEGFVPPDGVTPRTLANAVTRRYFDVLGINVLRGRAFTIDDRDTTPRVAIVNQTFASRFFSGRDAIGKRVGLCSSDPCGSSVVMMEIVGIAANAKYVHLREDQRSMVYVPFTQHAQTLREIEVRLVDGLSHSVATALYRELNNVDRRVAIVGMAELQDQVDRSLLPERLTANLSATFGLLSLGLAALGLYGVVAYLTTQRRGEIGIRMALGANRGDVRQLVLRDTFVLVAIGLAIGFPVALGAARLLSGQLYEVRSSDPLVLTIAVLTSCTVAAIAGYLPAFRASRVDPAIALREE